MLKPVRFVFCVIIMVIPSILCYPSFLAISYRSTWYFRMFPLVSLRFARVFLLFPLSVSPVSYFRFCLKRPLLLQCILFITHILVFSNCSNPSNYDWKNCKHLLEDLRAVNKYTDMTHLMKLTLPWWGGLSTKKFHPSASTRRAQLNVAATAVRSTDLLNCNVKTWVNTD